MSKPMKAQILKTIKEPPDRRIDICRRVNGTFGFEEYHYNIHENVWFLSERYPYAVLDTFERAESEARSRVPWLAVRADITWLTPPLFTNAGGAEISAGVSMQREWWIRSRYTGIDTAVIETETRASSNYGAMFLLPLMQPGYGGQFHDVRANLEQMLIAHTLSVELVSTLPFHAPVLKAYRDRSGWTELAALWLPEVPLEDRHIYELSDLSRNRAIPQKCRHAAERRIHKWEKDHGVCILRRRNG